MHVAIDTRKELTSRKRIGYTTDVRKELTSRQRIELIVHQSALELW